MVRYLTPRHAVWYAACFAILLTTCARPPATVPTPSPMPVPTLEAYVSPRNILEVVPPPRIVGYFSSWGIYARNFHVKTIETSGAAEQLTVINYAFAGPFDNRCILGDPAADYQRIYGAADGVDGEGNGRDVLRGHFGQLQRLKALHSDLKVLIAIGGWTFSSDFSDAALPENRAAFVESCLNVFIRGNIPGLDAPGAAAGLFDGIDIDWEYPAVPGRRGNVYRPEDTRNFTALLAEFRRQLDEIDPNLLLTIAGPAGEDKYSLMELSKIHPYLDWINIMAYDYHGAWDAEGPTNFVAPLYGSQQNPSADQTLNADYTVRAYLAAGIPASKLNLGVPFYGRGWTGVGETNNGLYQPATGPAVGLYEPGVNDYGYLRTLDAPGFHDTVTQGSWTFDGSTFWTFDDPEAIRAKTDYVRQMGLGGVMFWELAGDTRDGELVRAIYDGLFGAP